MAVLTNSTVLLRVRHTYGKFKCIKLSLAFKSLKCLSLISSFFFRFSWGFRFHSHCPEATRSPARSAEKGAQGETHLKYMSCSIIFQV